jgi:hypothetical protein
MEALIEMMQDRLTAIGEEVDGYKFHYSSDLYRYATLSSRICDDIIEADKGNEHHMALRPLIHGVMDRTNGFDPLFWFLAYEDMTKAFDYPIEVFMCLKLKYKDGAMVFHGINPLTEDEGSPHPFLSGNIPPGWAPEGMGIPELGLTENDAEPDERVDEAAYAFALYGVEQDWWDIDDIAMLPPRKKGVQNALKQEVAFVNIPPVVWWAETQSQQEEE